MKRIFAALALVALTAALATSCDGGTGQPSPADFIAACEKACVAAAEPMCTNGQTAEQCKLGCPQIQTAITVCQAEYVALLDCSADLEWTCMNGVATPTLTGCTAEAFAYSACQQNAPCQTYCDAAATAGCAPGGSADACVPICKDELDSEGFCDFELEDLRVCMGGQTLTCDNGEPKTSLCTQEKLDYADCLSFDDPCAAYCFLAADAGCPGAAGTEDGCIADCQTELAQAGVCDFEFRQLLECGAQNGVDCAGTEPATSASCTGDQVSYDDCKAMNP